MFINSVFHWACKQHWGNPGIAAKISIYCFHVLRAGSGDTWIYEIVWDFFMWKVKWLFGYPLPSLPQWSCMMFVDRNRTNINVITSLIPSACAAELFQDKTSWPTYWNLIPFFKQKPLVRSSTLSAKHVVLTAIGTLFFYKWITQKVFPARVQNNLAPARPLYILLKKMVCHASQLLKCLCLDTAMSCLDIHQIICRHGAMNVILCEDLSNSCTSKSDLIAAMNICLPIRFGLILNKCIGPAFINAFFLYCSSWSVFCILQAQGKDHM